MDNDTWRCLAYLSMHGQWSYGSWIYNYLCIQCLSLLTLWVLIPIRRGVLDTTLCDKVCQWLAAGQCFSPPIKLTPRYNRNIVQSGIKHHNLLPPTKHTLLTPSPKKYVKNCWCDVSCSWIAFLLGNVRRLWLSVVCSVYGYDMWMFKYQDPIIWSNLEK
jgi:hypothetical protein